MTESELEAALAAMRDVPVDVPCAAHREEVRTALLARALPPAQARSRRWLAVPLAAAAAALVAVIAWPPPALHAVALPVLPPLPARGHVHPLPGAVFTAASHVPDEIVTLHDGTIHLDVDPLRAGERFRVVIGKSEIEVRGTAFEVTANHDRLVDVHVLHGRVEVRPEGRATIVLVAGGDWTDAPVALPVAPAPVAPPVSSPPRPQLRAASLPPRVVLPSTDQVAYNDAWTALRDSQFELAAADFAKALASAPAGALADDARFWHAVALARGHAAGPAIYAFRELVDQHPGSIHAGEASAMLGWLLVDAKRLDEARERFTAAINDPSSKVRASAQAGIDALDSPAPAAPKP
ncbi:MAG TPA: FecR domain-containing protein [Kofleriaceae bacterium]